MGKVYLIDGHSVIFSTPDLAKLHVESGKIARSSLCSELTHFQDTLDVSVIVVFDGKGSKQTTDLRQDKDIMVIYTREGQSADSVIERLTASYSSRYDLQIVSNDRAVLDTASSFGAQPMSVKSFIELL